MTYSGIFNTDRNNPDLGVKEGGVGSVEGHPRQNQCVWLCTKNPRGSHSRENSADFYICYNNLSGICQEIPYVNKTSLLEQFLTGGIKGS
jgi:hypothetical protein